MSSAKLKRDISTLTHTVASTQSLLAQFEDYLRNQETSLPSLKASNAKNINAPPATSSPFQTLSNAAALLKAHTTKLTLLAINKPFAPSEITKILQTLSTSVLPVLVHTSKLLTPETWGKFVHKEAKDLVLRTIREFGNLIRDIPKDEKSQTQDAPQSSKKTAGMVDILDPTNTQSSSSLHNTALLFATCDSLAALSPSTIGSLACKEAEQYRETLVDAIEELKQWSEDIMDASSSDDDASSSKEHKKEDDGDHEDGDDSNSDSMFDFDVKRSRPNDKELLRIIQQATATLPKLRLCATLYTALLRRRLRPFPTPSTPLPSDVQTTNLCLLSKLLLLLKKLPDSVDELVGAFYDFDEQRATEILEDCVKTATEAADLMYKNWAAEEDQFTTWTAKWRGHVSGTTVTDKG